jgi:ketosteroid isomerase-like protein
MSQENLDLVVRGIQAASRRPEPDFDTVNALYHRDHVLVSLVANTLGEGEAKGAAGYKSWLQQIGDAVGWEGELKGAVDVGPHQVLVVTVTRFKGVSSGIGGIEMEERTWCVVTVDEGQITRTEVYNSPDQALEAAGLSG